MLIWYTHFYSLFTICDCLECFPFNYSFGSTHASVNIYRCHVHLYKFFFLRLYITAWNCLGYMSSALLDIVRWLSKVVLPINTHWRWMRFPPDPWSELDFNQSSPVLERGKSKIGQRLHQSTWINSPFYFIFLDLGEIHSRLLDHRPVTQGEIRYFVKEFEVSI